MTLFIYQIYAKDIYIFHMILLWPKCYHQFKKLTFMFCIKFHIQKKIYKMKFSSNLDTG